MIEVIVEEANGDQVGKYRFDVLPRARDEITLPWPDDPYGIRAFTVDQVVHMGIDVEKSSEGAPYTTLRVTELT